MPFRQTFAQLFAQDTTIAEVVFGLVAATLIVAFVLSWHRRRIGRRPSRKSTANRVELTYLTALIGVAAFLVVASLTANTKESTDPKPAMRVQVTGFQWCWRFHYVGQPVTVTAQCQGGPDPTLVLPTGKPVELDVTSVRRDSRGLGPVPAVQDLRLSRSREHIHRHADAHRPVDWALRAALRAFPLRDGLLPPGRNTRPV